MNKHFPHLLGVLSIAMLSACAAPTQNPGECDRNCLLAVGDEFVNALTFKDRNQIAPFLTTDVRATENGALVPVNESVLWKTAAGFPVRQSFADPVTGNYVLFAVSRDQKGDRAQVALRVRVQGSRRITEIEILTIHRGEHSLFEGGEPSPMLALWSTPVPLSGRASREELAHAANEYYDTLLRSDPKGLFHPDCDRVENGIQTSNNPATRGGISCTEGGKGYYGFIKGTRGRRMLVMDEELGVVVAFVHLDLPGTVKNLHIRGAEIAIPERNQVQRSSVVMAAYKVEYRHIKAIMARVREEGYLATTPWDR